MIGDVATLHGQVTSMEELHVENLREVDRPS